MIDALSLVLALRSNSRPLLALYTAAGLLENPR